MFQMWGKLVENNHILQDLTVCIDDEDTRTHKVFRALDEICDAWNLAKPIWLDTNISEFKRRSKTRFTQDNFIESLEFDYLEIQITEEYCSLVFAANKANAKAGHPAELGSGCSCSPLCGSVGCPALFMYFVPGFVPLLYHAVFHAAFQVRSNIFLHQSDQARAGFLRCPGDVRRDVQAVVVRHFQ